MQIVNSGHAKAPVQVTAPVTASISGSAAAVVSASHGICFAAGVDLGHQALCCVLHHHLIMLTNRWSATNGFLKTIAEAQVSASSSKGANALNGLVKAAAPPHNNEKLTEILVRFLFYQVLVDFYLVEKFSMVPLFFFITEPERFSNDRDGI